MTTEERLENLERELARAKRRNRRLLICAAVCLGTIFAWVFFAQPGLLGTAQASDPANPNEDEITKLQTEITRLQAEVNLLKRENERLRKELDEAKKDKSASAPTDAQGPSVPQPAATQTPGPDEPPTAVRIPGLPETDSSWWRDPEALTKHMQLRLAMSATNPQASVWMWLQRNNYFAEHPVQWTVHFNGSRYVDKDSASIEYYKCLGKAEKFSKEAEKSGVKKDEAAGNEACAAWYRGEAKAWKILIDAGGGLSLNGEILGFYAVHIVLPGKRTTAWMDDLKIRPAWHDPQVQVKGKIIALSILPGPCLEVVLTGRVTLLSKN